MSDEEERKPQRKRLRKAKEPEPEPIVVQHIRPEDIAYEEDDNNVQPMPKRRKYKQHMETVCVLLAPGDPLTTLCLKHKEKIEKLGVTIHHNRFPLPFADIWFVEVPTDAQRQMFGAQTDEVDIYRWLFTTQQLSIVAVIERKKIEDDLIQSIMKMRWSQQRDRMVKNNARIMLMAEGPHDLPMTRTLYRHCFTKHGVFVERTVDLEDSLMTVVSIAQDLNKGSTLRSVRGPSTKYNPAKQRYEATVAHVVGCIITSSFDIGMAVQHLYPTVALLCLAYERLDSVSAKEKMLENIKFIVKPDATCIAPTTVVKPRRIGPAVSKRVYQFLCDPEKLHADLTNVVDNTLEEEDGAEMLE